MSRDQPGVPLCLEENNVWDTVALPRGSTALFCFVPFFFKRKYITSLGTKIVIFNYSV